MNLKPPTVVAIGELLWDIFPDGPRFGGAPTNFAFHAASLGADTWLITGVGRDDLGVTAIERLNAVGLRVNHVTQSQNLPTGAVQVSLDKSGSASYHFNDCDAWDDLRWSDDLRTLADRCDAVCFGTLGQRHERSRSTIQRFIESTPATAWRILDLNLRPPFYSERIVDESLGLANVLKLNDDELDYVVKKYCISGDGEEQQLVEIAERFELRLVALTRGDQGSLLVSLDGKRACEVSDVDSRDTVVKDTVGAGDAFTAALVMGLSTGSDLNEINRVACQLAEYVCTQSGATPELPADLRAKLRFALTAAGDS